MFKTVIKNLKTFTGNLIGSPDELSLESRIFHTFSLFVLLILIFETFFNIFIHLYVSALLAFIVLAIQVLLFYLSRVKNKLHIAVIISAIEVNVIKTIGYFYNSGITGATLLLFSASLFILMSVSPKKWWPLLLIANLSLVFTITGLEYFDPNVIKQHYSTRAEAFADNIVTYIVTIILLYVGTAAIRKSYTLQKQRAYEKTLALELLNAEKVKLFSIISHDLRTPLASVQQYFDVLAEVELDQQERVELEKDLLLTIGNTQELLTNLLKWAKNQMDGTTAKLRPINLATYLIDTSNLFEAIALKKGIILNTIAGDDIIVKADPDMLQLVIRNLLNNAVKFTNSGGYVELKAFADNNNCIISISDNGIGIPLSMQAEVFSLSSSSTKGTLNEPGTGLGLVLCKDYTELQGGRIWFNSTEGKGTTFYISLPCV